MNGRLATLSLIAAVASIPAVAAGQTPDRGYIGGSIGAYRVAADAVDGTVSLPGLVAAHRLGSWIDLEGELARPASPIRREYTGITVSFAGRDSSFEEIQRLGVLTRTTYERLTTAVFSVGVAFHPRASARRVQPRAFVGVTNHIVRERTLRDPLQWPATVSLAQVLRTQPREERHARTLGSLTFGAGVAIAVTRTLAIAPDVRYDFGSIGDEINNALRAGVRVVWRF